jgi:phosphoglycerol transferase
LLRAVAAFGAALVLCLGILTASLKLWRMDWRVPFAYAADSLLVGSWVKAVAENGWYLHNPHVGAPFGQDMHDFPLAESMHFALMKLIALRAPNYAAVMNAYFLLTFPLTMLAALFVLRRLGISYGPALVVSALFTFLPYHLIRSENHLFLAAYFHVPLMVLLVLWLYREPLLFVPVGPGGWRWDWRSPRALAGLGICAVVACGGVYYAFFGCFFLLVAGAASACERKCWRPLVGAGLFILLVTAGVLANVAPNLAYRLGHGANPAAINRPSGHAEIYGMKVAQLLLPTPEHRVKILKKLRDTYTAQAPLCNENDIAALGFVGSAGFLFLIGRLLRRARPAADGSLLDALCVLNIFGVLVATVGGFGSLVALLATPMIRCYNRMSVYLAFFALLAVALVLQALRERCRTGRARALYWAGLALVLGVGLGDQVSAAFVPHYKGVKREFEADADFVRRVEASMPPGACIFQLPYMAFPESLPSGCVLNYDHLRGYLHSKTLRWSFGGMRGRDGDRWYAAVAKQAPADLVTTLTCTGFRGLCIDRRGYPLEALLRLEGQLAELLQIQPIISTDDRHSFFTLRPGG